MCNGINHKLKVIYEATNNHDLAGTYEVVRWCEECGAVVVDLDADERTIRPGGVRSIEFPTYAGMNK